MRTVLIILAGSLFFSLNANAQFFNSSHVPEAAKVSFHITYPHAKRILWSKDEQGYNARFDFNHKTYFAIYDGEGNSLAEVMELKKENLPARILKQLRENYKSFALKGAIMIKSIDGKVVYETHIVSKKEVYDLTFNISGYMLSAVPEVTAEGVED